MKNIAIHTLLVSLFLTLFGIGNVVKGQVIETDWEETASTEILDDLPSDLKKSLLPKILVSPNPSSEKQISVWYNQLKETSKIMIYDAAGRIYHSAVIGSKRDNKGVHKVPATKFSSGVYIVKLKSGIYESVAKFVIQ